MAFCCMDAATRCLPAKHVTVLYMIDCQLPPFNHQSRQTKTLGFCVSQLSHCENHFIIRVKLEKLSRSSADSVCVCVQVLYMNDCQLPPSNNHSRQTKTQHHSQSSTGHVGLCVSQLSHCENHFIIRVKLDKLSLSSADSGARVCVCVCVCVCCLLYTSPSPRDS